MGYNFPGLFMHGRNAAARTKWTFEVDRSHAPVSVAWRWERQAPDEPPVSSADVFPTFAECARDARSHGFSLSDAYTLTDRVHAPESAWAGSSPAAGLRGR